MNRKITFIGIAAFLIISLSAFSFTTTNSTVSKGRWVKLGSKQVNFKAERDVVRVGSKDGKFRRLKIVVKGGSINMHRMVVNFGNNTKQKVALKHNFKSGSESRVVDLKGNKRTIKNIEFYYDSRITFKGKATLTVFGGH